MSRNNYTIKELVEDPSFLRVVKGIATFDEIERWSNWMGERSQNRAKAKSAMAEIVGFHFKSPNLPDIEKKWAYLSSKTVELESVRLALLSKKRKKKNNLK